jgi:nucleotide-binding universal stress UspA family protein
MTPPASTAPIVVGIDGSPAAVDAAMWAADEALSRGVPLRLVYVIAVDEEDTDLDEDPAEFARDWPETEYGRVALRGAATAVQDTGKPISVETQILWGEIGPALIKESQHATMLCVGSTGIALVCLRTLGSIAATVAEHAHSSVAVIRTPHATPTSEPDWIVTVVDNTPQNQAVVEFALDEAHLRRAPVLALAVSRQDHQAIHPDELDHRVASWRKRRTRVHIYPVTVPTDVTRFLAEHDELSVQLTVMGADDATHTPAIVGPHRQTRKLHSRCSVLVVR